MIYVKSKMDNENYELVIMTNAIIDEPVIIEEEFFRKANNDLDILSVFINLSIKSIGKRSNVIHKVRFKYADLLVPDMKDSKCVFIPVSENQKRSIA